MILNNRQNQFSIWLPSNFFYPEINERWLPVIKRLKLPFEKTEDFINTCIQSISFPGLTLPVVEQQAGQYKVDWRGGKEMEPIFEKSLSITFKMSEGFFSYWMLFEQIELYLKYGEKVPFWPPVHVSFLDNHGFELISFDFELIIPSSLSQFDISYTQVAADFNTFSMGLKYSRFNIRNKLNK